MPVFLNNFNLIFSKSILEKKYPGGCDKFRIEHQVENIPRCQEDDELFLLAFMNSFDIDLEFFEKKGLHIQDKPLYSKDFGLIAKYDGNYWETNWLETDSVFAWHIDCQKWQIDKAKEISNMNMDKLENLQKNGIDPFETIKSI